MLFVRWARWGGGFPSGSGRQTGGALLAIGAKARPRIIEDGETWRLLVANLLHRDIVHLGFNLFALLNIAEGEFSDDDPTHLCRACEHRWSVAGRDW